MEGCKLCDCTAFQRHLWKGENVCQCMHDIKDHNGDHVGAGETPKARVPPPVTSRPLPTAPLPTPNRKLPQPPGPAPTSAVRAEIPQKKPIERAVAVNENDNEEPPPRTSTMSMVREAVQVPEVVAQEPLSVNDANEAPMAPASSSLSLATVLGDAELLNSFEQFLQNETTPENDGLAALHFLFSCIQFAEAQNDEQRMEIANEIYDLHFNTVYIPEEIVNAVAECELLDQYTFSQAQQYIEGELERAWLPSFLKSGLVSMSASMRSRGKTLMYAVDGSGPGGVAAVPQPQSQSQLDFDFDGKWRQEENRAACVNMLGVSAEAAFAFIDGVEGYKKLNSPEASKEAANTLFRAHLLPSSPLSLPLPEEVVRSVLESAVLNSSTFDLSLSAVYDWLEANYDPSVAKANAIAVQEAEDIPSQPPRQSLPPPPPPKPRQRPAPALVPKPDPKPAPKPGPKPGSASNSPTPSPRRGQPPPLVPKPTNKSPLSASPNGDRSSVITAAMTHALALTAEGVRHKTPMKPLPIPAASVRSRMESVVKAMPELTTEEWIKKIVESEQEFVSQMDLFAAMFIQPLLFDKQVVKEDQQTLFGHIDPCLTIHRRLQTDLDTVVAGADAGVDGSEREEIPGKIGDVFLRLSDFFKVYTQYCNNFSEASKLLLKLIEEDSKKKVPELHQFVQRAADLAKDAGSPIDILESLVLPVQRVEQYPMMLKGLMSSLPADYGSKKSIEDALKKFEALLVSMKESEKQYANVQQILEIQRKLDGGFGGLEVVVPGRVFLREGDVNCVTQQSGKMAFLKRKTQESQELEERERHLFLFSDLIVFTKKSLVSKVLGKKYHFKEAMPTQGAKISDVDVTVKLNENTFAFKITSQSAAQSITVSCSSAAEKKKWVKAIEAAIGVGAGGGPAIDKVRDAAEDTKLRSKYGDILIKMLSKGGIHVEDHKQMLRVYPKTFFGADGVDWLLTYCDVETRDEALDLLTEMVEDGVIESVGIVRTTTFRGDNMSLYRFKDTAAHTMSGTGDGTGGDAEDLDAKIQQLRYIRQGPKSFQEQLEVAALEERSFLIEECERLKEKLGDDANEVKAVEAILFAFEHQVAVIMPWMTAT